MRPKLPWCSWTIPERNCIDRPSRLGPQQRSLSSRTVVSLNIINVWSLATPLNETVE